MGCGPLLVGMRPEQRLRQRGDFDAVYRRARPYRSDLFVLRALRTDLPSSRFGFPVRQAVGNAVVRNRIKRRLREAVSAMPIAGGWDVVVSARVGAADADYQRLRKTVRDLMTRAGVLNGAKRTSTG